MVQEQRTTGTRAAYPMFPGRLFRSPAFSAGNAAVFAVNASLTGDATPSAFTRGFATAFAVAAGLAVLGAAAGTALRGRGPVSGERLPTGGTGADRT